MIYAIKCEADPDGHVEFHEPYGTENVEIVIASKRGREWVHVPIAELEFAVQFIRSDRLPAGLTVSDDGNLLNWRGENYVRQVANDVQDEERKNG